MGSAWTRFLVFSALACSLYLLQAYVEFLEFDRQNILAGEVWRIWTGYLVHTNTAHLSLNLVALLIIYFAFFTGVNVSELFFCTFIFMSLISLTLLWIYPSLVWYNGLSGLLYALVAYFSMCLARDGKKIFWAALVIVWGKVLIEMMRAYYGYESLSGGMRVITEAHLIGVFFGSGIAIIRILYLHDSLKVFRVRLNLP